MVDKNHPIILRINKELELLRPNSLVYDLGTSSRYSKEVGYLKPILEKYRYFAIGYDSPECDIKADVHDLPLKSNSADLILCFEVIEHVKNPTQVVSEIHRVLKPGGILILTTPFLATFHGKGDNFNDGSHNNYPDFWRFTHQGLQLLCEKFNYSEVIPFTSTYGYYLHMVISLIKQSWIIPIIHKMPINKIVKVKLGNPTYRHLAIARK